MSRSSRHSFSAAGTVAALLAFSTCATAHVITPLAQLPQPTALAGGVSPNELFGAKGGFLAKRAYEDITNCDGAGVLTCGGGNQYCYSGVNNYLGCCNKGTSCLARTSCVPYSALTSVSCDHDRGGCVRCTESSLPNCVRVENAGGQYGLYCDVTKSTRSYSAVKVFNTDISTARVGSAAAVSTDISSSASPSSTGDAPPSETSIRQESTGGGGGLSAGALGGIIAGAVIVGLAAGAFLWFCLRKRSSNKYGPPGKSDVPGPDSPHNNGNETHAKHLSPATTSAGGVFPSPGLPPGKAGAPWNADTLTATGGVPYRPGPEGAELDSSPIHPYAHSPHASVSSFTGSQRYDPRASALSTMSPLNSAYDPTSSGPSSAHPTWASEKGAPELPLHVSEEAGGAHLLDGSEISGELPTNTAYRLDEAKSDHYLQEARACASFPSYLSPENALGGGYERDEARLREEEKRRSQEPQ